MQQQLCKYQKSRTWANTNDVNSLEQATTDPSTLAQETIIDNLDPKEAARLSRVRNIGIAVRMPGDPLGFRRNTEQYVGAHRQRQDHGYRTRPLLHRPDKSHSRSARQGQCWRQDGLYGSGARKRNYHPICGYIL